MSTTPVTFDQSTIKPIEADPLPHQAQALQGAVSYASQQNPDHYAKLLKFQQVTGIPPVVSKGNEEQVRQTADTQRIDPHYLTTIAPNVTAWATHPDNAAVSGVDEINRMAGIEQNAVGMRAYTPSWIDRSNAFIREGVRTLTGKTTDQLQADLYQNPLTRAGIDVVGGAAGLVGNVGSFFGIHGSDATKQNLLQRIETGLSPEENTDPNALFHKSNEFDWLAKNVAPMIPAVLASGGTSALATALKISPTAAKVLAGLTVGGMFTADQAGKTYTQLSAAGASGYDARLAANRVAAINAVPNALFGATDVVSFMRDNPILTSLGMGGVTGASGQVSQNVVTGRPTFEGVPAAAVQGAAVQAGMHLGTDAFFSNVQQAVDSTAESALRDRSPEKFTEAMTQAFQGEESFRIPADQFAEYFKAQNQNPSEVAASIGSTNYAEAALSGGDVEIPKADYLSKLDPEHQKALMQDIVDPTSGLTMRQHQEGRDELQQWVSGGGPDSLIADAAQADAETATTPEFQQVKEELRQRYIDAGETPEVADTLAEKDANVYSNIAKSASLKPSELLAMYNPKVSVGEAPADRDLNQAVFHGSPYQFDKFTLDKIGSGEGFQAYGHGLYFAGNKAVAEYYRKALSDSSSHQTLYFKGEKLDPNSPERHAASLLHFNDAREIKSAAKRWLKEAVDGDKAAAETARNAGLTAEEYWGRLNDFVQKNKRKDITTAKGQLYEAEIPDDKTMLQWDRPLSAQTPEVRAALEKAGFAVDDKAVEDHSDALLAALSSDEDIEVPKQPYDPSGESLYGRLSREKGGPAGASKFLHSLGVDGIKYLDGNSRGESAGSHNYVVFDDNAIKIAKTYYQGGEDSPRGWFKVNPDGSYEIGRTKIGDFSTFAHESAHAYLHVLGDLATREGASETLKNDHAKIMEWLGAKPGEELTTEQQETWARANEQYLREGKAPSSKLRGAFQRFGVWLQSVYKKASDLGVTLSSDIRGVLDRLYAAEQGVDRAASEAGPQMFTSAEEAGWTDEQFQNYADAHDVSVAQAKEHILSKLNDARLRDAGDAWREEEKNVREAVTAEIDQKPEYAAIRALRKGTMDDGTAISINREELVKQFGTDRVKELQKQHPGMYRNEGGMAPDTAAELLGFNNAGEMVAAMQDTPRRSAAIEEATRAYMTAKHGDIRYDGSLEDQARLAVENDKRADGLHRELTALKKKLAAVQGDVAATKQAMRDISVAPIAAYRAAAEQMVEAKSLADLQPVRYLDASRKYAREAFDALRKGDTEEAANAKHKELLNHFLFREATKAKEYVGKFESYAKRMTSPGMQKQLGLAGSDYRDQFNRILGRYGLSQPVQTERTLWNWMQDEQDNKMKTPAIDEALLDEARTINYRNAPIGEIRLVHDALVNVRELAKQELRMTVGDKKIDFESSIEQMVQHAREKNPAKPVRVLTDNETKAEAAKRLLQGTDAAMTRMEFIVKRLDGGMTGPWHDYLFNLSADAQGREYALQKEVVARTTAALEHMTAAERKSRMEKVAVDGIPETVTRKNLISWALNMGNEGNRDRLEKTFAAHGWNPEALEKVPSMLTRGEWKFVQGIWDSLKPLGEAQADLERRQTGLAPQMVKAVPLHLELADGPIDLEGGYYPIQMDSRFSRQGAQQDTGQTAQNLMEAGYARAATSRGAMKERTNYGGPLAMDYEQVLTQHIAKVTKDISHREFMLSANKFLSDDRIRGTIRETLGQQVEEQMLPWLRTIVNDRNGSSVQGLSVPSQMIRGLRTNLVKAALTFKASTILLQLTHASSIFLHTSPKSYSSAMIDFLAKPREMSEMIANLSPNEMASRGDNLDRDMRKVLQDKEFGKKGISTTLAKAGMLPVQYMDHLLSFPLWLSVYRDAQREGLTDTQSMHKADGAVRMGLGSNAPKDLPPVMRNNDFWKLVTTLGGFHNLKYNQIADVNRGYGANRRAGDGSISSAAQLTYGLAMAAIIPAILGQFITGHGPKDDENAAHWAIVKALLFPVETIPLLGSVAEAIDRGGDASFSPLAGMADRAVTTLKNATSDSEEKDWTGLGMSALQTAMEAAGVPGTDQIAKTARYVRKVAQGRIEDPNPFDAITGNSSK